jgi:(1->4)-alpha-D-glucan 1-alpha-D-glucosylmutase
VRGGEADLDADFDARKLHLIVRALGLRARREALFRDGSYRPLEAGAGVCAFARGAEVLVLVGVRAWNDAVLELPAELTGEWRSVLGTRGAAGTPGARVVLGGRAALAELLDADGLALLERPPDAGAQTAS